MSDGEEIRIAPEELTQEEQLQLALAESRSREADLAVAIAQRTVTDARNELAATRQRIAQAALSRRAKAAAVPTPAPNRAARRRGRKS